ncbi:MAG: serine--tRNA ligase [Nanoarchaeota archaeon]
MIDINLLRDNPDLVKDNIKRKGQDEKVVLVDTIIDLDRQWRACRVEADTLRHERNKVSQDINETKKSGGDIKHLLNKAKEIPAKLVELENKEKNLQEEIKKHLSTIPNIFSKETPKGKDGSQNVEIMKSGKIPKFSFTPKNHVELLENLGLVDFDASAKSSGNGFYYLKGELAILNQALIRFGIDFMRSKGYDYIETPLMLNNNSLFASMNKEAIEQSVYRIAGEDLGLIGTSEQALLALHSGKTILESDLPKKYFSYSMCFRKEVGAHGINERGLWRTHQFNKIEQFVFCKPEDSIKIYDELLKNSVDILKTLDLPFRVIEICTGDLADWKYRSADLEVYRPTTKEYGEVMSLSNCTDYQARKLDIKCVDSQGVRRVLHTLNDTALATSRIMVCIIENNQQEDGSITIPKSLWKYTGFKEMKAKKVPARKEEKSKVKKVVKKNK